ncbi:tripartite tricarboxylate transporter permease [Celeribacter halophilus]|jgi:putative tricarboxylic transport membrane protein|uniref:tripartite tricarboxylate transporter permease n=1 Tax=Celeribacter halophilus TaxID=576117 RepID=UPI001C09C465|nr:tripartite tricarboxylate transporter permease [Celeribacter halophilus]MBU2890829.1 tripartite tricarboxylate transporter permease [Celeribacter halophilus]MDO6510006.1 tripartite tricarboxylate transporter permease [Celeribacter halophilus]
MEVFLSIAHAAPGLLDFHVILAMIVGTAVGIAVGALPGLSATMGIAVLIPLTFTMEPLVALGMIAGIYNGAMYGGSIPAILLRIPGTPAGIATVFDGHEMAKKGKARLALDISLVSSSIGSAVSAVALLLIAPPLAVIALKFSPANYFWLAIFGMTTIAIMMAGNPEKGILSVCFGLCIGIVGIDTISGNERFTFGTVELLSGIHIVVLLTGLYAIPPAIDLFLGKNAIDTGGVDLGERSSGFPWPSLIPTWIRASGIGLVVGLIPALGGNIAALLAWQEERRHSKNKENWGKGEPAGLAAPECANNADTAATLIPALTLGIPGNAVAAVILGALLVHGLRPGPDLFRADADITYGFMLTMLVTSGLMFVIGKLGARAYVNVLRVPRQLLGPIIIVLTVVGIYAIHNSIFEVILMLVFGLIGFAMEKMSIPTAPAVLAVILGPIAEENFRRALLISGDNYWYLFKGPISITLVLLVVVALVSPWLPRLKLLRRKPKAASFEE